MIGLLSNHLVASAGKEGMSVLTQHGGIGVGLGAMYGAVSDNETIIGGAFRGGVVGAGAGFGAKYFGTKYVQGMNAHAAHTLNTVSKEVRQMIESGTGRYDFSKNMLDQTGGFVAAGVHSSRFNKGGYNSRAFSFADKEMGAGWFGGTTELSSDVTKLQKFHTGFNKATADFKKDKLNYNKNKHLFNSMLGKTGMSGSMSEFTATDIEGFNGFRPADYSGNVGLYKKHIKNDDTRAESLSNRFKENLKIFNTNPSL